MVRRVNRNLLRLLGRPELSAKEKKLHGDIVVTSQSGSLLCNDVTDSWLATE